MGTFKAETHILEFQKILYLLFEAITSSTCSRLSRVENPVNEMLDFMHWSTHFISFLTHQFVRFSKKYILPKLSAFQLKVDFVIFFSLFSKNFAYSLFLKNVSPIQSINFLKTALPSSVSPHYLSLSTNLSPLSASSFASLLVADPSHWSHL